MACELDNVIGHYHLQYPMQVSYVLEENFNDTASISIDLL